MIEKLCRLGFLPSPNLFLPHCGSAMLLNLERYWIQNLQHQRSLLINPPLTFNEHTIPSLARDSQNKTVSFITDTPVYANNRSVLCGTCQESVDQCCDEGLYDISNLGFVEDKCLHTLHFYSKHLAHAGHMEFEQMKEMYHLYSIFFKLIHHFDQSHFVIKEISDETIQLRYQPTRDFSIVLQEIKFFKPELSDISVLRRLTYLSHWYLAIILDKFENDNAPNFAAFHPRVAPYHVGIIPSEKDNQDINSITVKIFNNLNDYGVLSKIFESDAASGNLGVPFDVLVDNDSVMREHVKLRDRKDGAVYPVPSIPKLPEIFKLYWNSVTD